jgi:hypothetical protein
MGWSEGVLRSFLITPTAVTVGALRSDSNERRVNVEKKILNAMKKAGKPVRPGDVAKMIGEESKDVSKVMSGLKKDGKIMSPKRCYYALSK